MIPLVTTTSPLAKQDATTPLSFNLLTLQRNNLLVEEGRKGCQGGDRDKKWVEGLYQRPRGHSPILGSVGRQPKVNSQREHSTTAILSCQAPIAAVQLSDTMLYNLWNFATKNFMMSQ